MNQFPPSPCSSRCTAGVGVVDIGGKWKKSSIIKVFILLFGHFWEVELTYRYIFAFKFTLRSQRPDIVPIFCPSVINTVSKFAAGIINTSETGGKICRRCCWYRWSTLTCEYLREFSKKFKTVLLGYSGAGGKLIHEKNQKQKISWHCPFK